MEGFWNNLKWRITLWLWRKNTVKLNVKVTKNVMVMEFPGGVEQKVTITEG